MNNIIPIQTELSFKVRELATDTRNESYITLDEGDVEYWHKRMIEAYQKYGNLCDHYMRQIIGLEIHLVSARRNDLTKPYYIEKYGFMVVKAKDEFDVPIRKHYLVKKKSNGGMKNSSGQEWKLIKVK